MRFHLGRFGGLHEIYATTEDVKYVGQGWFGEARKNVASIQNSKYAGFR